MNIELYVFDKGLLVNNKDTNFELHSCDFGLSKDYTKAKDVYITLVDESTIELEFEFIQRFTIDDIKNMVFELKYNIISDKVTYSKSAMITMSENDIDQQYDQFIKLIKRNDNEAMISVLKDLEYIYNITDITDDNSKFTITLPYFTIYTTKRPDDYIKLEDLHK